MFNLLTRCALLYDKVCTSYLYKNRTSIEYAIECLQFLSHELLAMATNGLILINPLRLELSNFVGPLPLVKQVLAHFLYLSKEARESRPGKWSKQELYNTTAADLLAFCADSSIPDSVVVWVKASIVT